MNTNRTGGMTAVAVLNFIFGGWGMLVNLLVVLGGGLLAVFGGAVAASGESGGAAAAGAGIGLTLVGLLGLFAGLLLFIGGFGILKMKPWARQACLAYAGIAVIVNLAGIALLSTGFGLTQIIGFAYPAILAYLFLANPQWKQAFTPSSSSASHSRNDQDNYRAAA
ncbi:MAG TPA: hypothetical protein PLU35_04815 [Phycisphaerales bacterium]|nr:hypothetical protein [Phycisphaerales bacterium]